MTPKTWIELRSELFKRIEAHRYKTELFRIEQVYLFITRCSRLFSSPGTKGAIDALNAIGEEGTFLLVADSLTRFQELFPTAETDEDTNNQNGLRPSPDRDAVRPIPDAQQMGVRKPTPQSPVRSQARGSSGRPIDVHKFQRLKRETMEVQEMLAAREITDDPPVATRGVARLGATSGSSGAVESRTPLLDERHQALLRALLQRPSWQLAELRTLASRAGLMPLACVATLNEWTTDNYGDLILEGEEILTVNQNLKLKL